MVDGVGEKIADVTLMSSGEERKGECGSTDQVKWRRRTAVAGNAGRDVMGEGGDRG